MKKTLIHICLVLSILLCAGCEEGASSAPEPEQSTKHYTVTFYSDESTVFTSVKVKEGDKATKPDTTPSIKGKGKFRNWVKDLRDEDGTIYDFSSPVTSDIKLYASYYTLKTVTLYKSDGITELRKVEVSYSFQLEKPDDDFIDGCLIKKWVTLDDRDYDFSTPVTVDMGLKAVSYEEVTESIKKEALAYMKIKDALLSTTDEKSGETIKGFEKETLAAVYLFSSFKSKNNIDIDKKNIYPYWTIDGTNYYLYRKGMDSLTLNAFLYYEIGDFSCSYYPPTITKDETVIEIDSFKLPITFYKGKYNPKTDKVEKDEEEAGSEETILINKIKIVEKADGSSSMKFVINGNDIEYKETNTVKDGLRARTIILTKDGKEYGIKEYFPTITFDSVNGERAVICEVLSGTEVSKPLRAPSSPSGYKLFKEWTLNGIPYDFSTPVTENITLKATYWPEAEYKKILEAVCINNITDNLSKCTNFMAGTTSNERAFKEGDSVLPYLTYSLLSALFQIDDNMGLYILSGGNKYSFNKDNQTTYVIEPILDGIDISKNKSSKSSDNNTLLVKCQGMKLKASYALRDKSSSLGAESASFDIDGTIKTESDGKIVTTAHFSSEGKTYPTLTVTKSTLSNGKTQLKYEYDGLTFYKVYCEE